MQLFYFFVPLVKAILKNLKNMPYIIKMQGDFKRLLNKLKGNTYEQNGR